MENIDVTYLTRSIKKSLDALKILHDSICVIQENDTKIVKLLADFKNEIHVATEKIEKSISDTITPILKNQH
jgi:GTP-binding protein EngB required for normal cell division